MYSDNRTTRERLAQFPFGLIIFLMMIISLSYYFEKVAQRTNHPTGIVQVQKP